MDEALCVVKWYAFDWSIIKHFEVSFPPVSGHSFTMSHVAHWSAVTLHLHFPTRFINRFILVAKYQRSGYFMWLIMLESKMISRKCGTVFK